MKTVHFVILALGSVSMVCHQLALQVPTSAQPYVGAAGALAASLAATLGVLSPSAKEPAPVTEVKP